MSTTIALDAVAAGNPPQGIGHYARDLAAALAADPGEFRYRLYLPAPAIEVFRHLSSPAMTLVPCFFPRGPGGRILFQHLILPGRARRDGAVLLHALGNLLPLRWQGPSVLTIHDLDFLEHPSYSSAARRLFFGCMTPRSLRKAGRVIAISRWTAGTIYRRYPALPPEKVAVIPHGPPPPAEAEPQAVAAVRRRLDLDRPYFLALGSLERRKNLAATVRAFERFRHGGGRALLVLAGRPGFGAAAIEEAVRRSPEKDSIRLTGWLPAAEITPLLAGAAGLVLLSEAEGFGLPALEAMAAGCPVVAARAAALPEVCGDAALLVDAGDGEAAAAMTRLLGEPGLRERLVAAGKERLAAFSWEEHGRRVRDLYRTVLGG